MLLAAGEVRDVAARRGGDESRTERATGAPAIEVEGLTKSFADLVAVDDLSFQVSRGEIFGFLGPNGSGKTTAMKAMLGLLTPDAGLVTIEGEDVSRHGKAAKSHVGFLPERLSFYDNLTPVQTLAFFARLKGVDVDEMALLADVGLAHAADRRVGTFSKGMTQLLGVAQATIGDPSVYVLDEPMSGLDPRWTKRVRERIRALNADGATVFLSSHNLPEVQTLCDRVAIIDAGRLLVTDTVANLSTETVVRPRLVLTVPEVSTAEGIREKIDAVVEQLESVAVAGVVGDEVTITAAPARRATIVAALVERGVGIADLQTHDPSLEDIFVELVAASEEAGAR